MTETAPSAQNWEAFLKLDLRSGQDKTHLVPIQRRGPLSVQRPFYPEARCCHVYLLHPPGGVVGGDRLNLELNINTGAEALFTAPGATKFYLSAGDTAQVEQAMEVSSGAELEFLPQENIYFPGARVRSKTSVNVQGDARFMLWEKHCFGRPANHELFASGEVISQIEINTERGLIFTEKQRVDADELKRASGLRQNPVIGSFLIYGAEFNKSVIQKARNIVPLNGVCGLTQVLPELMVIRYMGKSTADLNTYFIRLWVMLRPLIMQREACRPRIWNT